jgi:hypothetical protein
VTRRENNGKIAQVQRDVPPAASRNPRVVRKKHVPGFQSCPSIVCVRVRCESGRSGEVRGEIPPRGEIRLGLKLLLFPSSSAILLVLTRFFHHAPSRAPPNPSRHIPTRASSTSSRRLPSHLADRHRTHPVTSRKEPPHAVPSFTPSDEFLCFHWHRCPRLPTRVQGAPPRHARGCGRDPHWLHASHNPRSSRVPHVRVRRRVRHRHGHNGTRVRPVLGRSGG